jgi:hypothetical protein
MYRPPSESLKHKSANAKRTASILRGIAELPDLSTTDQNTLAKAARVLDAMRLVMLWPAGSWLDQLAIIRTQPEWQWVAETLNKRETTVWKPAVAARRLIADYLQQARTAEAQSIAWAAANGRGDVATLEAQRRVTLDRAREDAQTQIAALRVEAIMESEQVAA